MACWIVRFDKNHRYRSKAVARCRASRFSFTASAQPMYTGRSSDSPDAYPLPIPLAGTVDSLVNA